MLKKIMLLIAAGYALVLALVLVLGLMAIGSMERLHSITNDLYLHPFMVNNAAQEALAIMPRMRDDILVMVLSDDSKAIEELSSGLLVLEKNAREKMVVVEALFLGDIGRIKEVERLLEQWQLLRERESELVRLGQKEAAMSLVKESGARIYEQLNTHMDYVITFTKQHAATLITEADKEAASKIILTQWLLAGLIASITLSGWYVARHIFFLIRREERVEAALRKNSVELAAANKELEAFSYSVSHDLRTPLRAIDGFSHILLEDYNDKLDEEGKRLLNVVRDNTSRMGQLIDDILQFSRAGRLEMNFHEIDMDSMAREVYEELRPAAGHEPHVEIARLPSAMGDRAMMRQVWVNLLSNAIKFTSVTEGARIEVSGFVEGDETVYVVKDNGAGFDMQYVGNLFGVFQRLHGVNEFEGTGIGLAMVKRIVNRHGGRVWAEGKINEGATFYFALPN